MTETPKNPADETKSEKFQRIAGMRASRIIDDLRLLGNCGNASTYEYTANDTYKMFLGIEKELERVRRQFNKPVPLPYTVVAADQADLSS